MARSRYLSGPMTTVSADIVLHPIGGEERTLEELTSLFHLVVVAIDPYEYESSWILATAGRILTEYEEADCRVAWLVTAPEEDAVAFLGPWAERMLTLCDPNRIAVNALGITEIPALVHIGTDRSVVGKADGWDPEAWKPITIHHLLTHTSGIPSYTNLPDFRLPKFRRVPLSPIEIAFLTKDKPLEFAPGEKMSYNNTGYVLLGHIVEKASGEKYADYLKKHIFGPLDMNESGYDDTQTILPNRAAGYTRVPEGYRNADFLDMSLPHAAGSLYSTLGDLYRWDRSLYTEKMLTKKSLETMFTPVKNDYGYGDTLAPVAEQAASSKIASNARPSHQPARSVRSQAFNSALRPKRSRFWVTRVSRLGSISMASSSASGASSNRWQVLPPGAQQASNRRMPAWGAIKYAASCAASSCTLISPSAKPGRASTGIASTRVMPAGL